MHEPAIPDQLAVLFALEREAKPFLTYLTLTQRGKDRAFLNWIGLIGDRPILVVVTGVGKDAMEKAILWVMSQEIEFIIIAGFAGGLRPDIKVGDVVLANEVIDGEALVSKIAIPPQLLQETHLKVGRLFTADQILCHPDQKQEAYDRYQACMVDMESSKAVEIAQEYRRRCLVIRAISDDFETELPESLQKALFQGRVSLSRVFFFLLFSKKFRDAVFLLMKSSGLASKNLSSALFQLIYKKVV